MRLHRTNGAGAPSAAISLGLAACAAAVLCDDASAATLRGPASTLGVLALAGPLLLLRDWPGGLASSLGLVGTLLAGAIWLCRTRPLPAWFPWSPAARLAMRAPRHGRRWQAEGARVTRTAGSRAPGHARLRDDANLALEAARRCFIDLQAAWDAQDEPGLLARTTPEMYRELQSERARLGAAPNRTDVVTLEAELLGLEVMGSREVASVAFSGMIRESPDAGAMPFREVWMLVRDAGADWRLARHQALL